MGSAISMVRKTYVIGRSNQNAPSLYRKHNCYDHLFPYEPVRSQSDNTDIKLAVMLEAFGSLMCHKLNIEDQTSTVSAEETEQYKRVIGADKILQRLLVASPEAQDVRIELVTGEKQVYLCRNYIIELNEDIGNLEGITVFQTCCNYLKYLPYSIGQLRSLKMLIVSRNRLVELPDEIGLCKELREIDISFNLLRQLPRAIIGLKKLNTLHIAGNYFDELPSFIGKLYSLKYLSVGHNPLSSIPLEVFKLPFLLSLSCENCNFVTRKSFREIGSPTLQELVARHVVKNNLPIRRDAPVCNKDYFLRVQECSFCGGPFFDSYIEIEDVHTFELNAYPVRYRMCCRHYKNHEERLRTLFEKNMSTFPTRLLQDSMPSVTELFEPLCFNESQLRRMSEGLNGNGPTMPLICLAKHNTCFFKRFNIDRLLNANIENFNVFD